MLSEYNYHCPSCSHKLNQNSDLHFLASHNTADKSKLLLSKEPGVYGYKSTHELQISNGDRIRFYCEKCEMELESKSRPYFVEILLVVSNDVSFKLFFSPVCGEKKTYVDMDGELARFGSDFFSVIAKKKAS